MDKFKHGTMVWNDISCSHLYNYMYLHGNPEYLLYYCTWKHGLLELLLPIHNTLCAVYMYYTMNVYNYNNLSCYCQWADGAETTYTYSGFPVPTTYHIPYKSQY